MKTTHKYLLFIFLIIAFGCKEKGVDKALTKTEMVSRTWICDQAEATLASGKQIIYKIGLDGSPLNLKDSFVTFFNDGTYQGRDFNQILQKGDWKFTNNETVAELVDWDYDFNIVTLTSKNLDFNTKVQLPDGRVIDVFVKMIPKI